MIKKLFCLLFLASTVSAGSLANLRWEILDQLHISTSGSGQLSTASTDTLIQRGLRMVCTDFPAYPRDTTLTLVSGTNSYTAPPQMINDPTRNAIIWCSIKESDDAGDTVFYPIAVVPSQFLYMSIYGKDKPSGSASPMYVWAYNSKVYVYPTPKRGDVLYIGYQGIPADIAVIDSTVSKVTASYKEHLITACCMLACYKLGRLMDGNLWAARYEALKGAPQQ